MTADITPEAKMHLMKGAGLPHPPTDLTYVCRMAVSAEGPKAAEWADKPHRIVYDLCREVEALAAENARLRGISGGSTGGGTGC